MPNQVLISSSKEPELHLLPQGKFDEGLWDSLKANFNDTFFPEKLPPLQLTSRPVRVREIWGDYNYRKRGAWVSMFVHTLAVAGLIAFSIVGVKVVKKDQQESVQIIAHYVSEYMPLSKKKDYVVGGGGGVRFHRTQQVI